MKIKKNNVRNYYVLVRTVFRSDVPGETAYALLPCRKEWFGARYSEIGDIVSAAALLCEENKVEDVIELLTKLGVEWED